MPARTSLPRVHEVLIALVFIAMAVLDPDQNPLEMVLVLVLGALQLAEVRLPVLETKRRAVIWILLKLALALWLIGISDKVNSHYYLMTLLPVVSAATYFGALGTLAFSVLAATSVLSFLFSYDWPNTDFPLEYKKIFALNLLFIVITGQLVNLLAEAIRAQSAKYKAVADQLSETNKQLREAEAAVRRSERLAALGQLSAGLAHELRNPLGTIRASAEMLSRNVAQENEVAREVAGYISSEVDRCNSLVTRFLDFARPLALRLAETDLTQVIDRSIEMVNREAQDHDIAIYRNYAPDVPPIPMDAELMERVFFNVLQNAVQASAPGSSVTVKTRTAGDMVETCVIDRGSGIDPKLIETIFNPFVTTKPNGVGLGLAIVSRIVDRHGGKMSVESQPGEGSVFHISLPTRAAETSSYQPISE
jgi:two-component system sensor histidine kinase HydH